ncbi:MAG TPA: glycosyltransferase, partial [Thermoanaerobaculia bacterium]|nr:glycosyltransferase [Thermoanaerobaculia bacterium]
MKSLRLLHVLPTYLPPWHDGGPVVAVHGLCQALAARGHKVTVFTTDDRGAAANGETQGLLPFDGVDVWYFPVARPRRLYRSPAMAERLKSELEGAGNFDLIHLHSVFLWPTHAVARAAERADVPYVVAPRGMLVRALLRRRGWLRKWLWIWLRERRTLTCAAAIHATSNLEKRDIEALGLRLESRIFVVGNGVDAESLAPVQDAALAPTVRAALERRREEGQVRHLLLFLGRLSWKKGLDRLIKALAKVKDATLIIAGHDEEG